MMHYFKKAALFLIFGFNTLLAYGAPDNGVIPNTMVEDFVKTCTLQFPLVNTDSSDLIKLNISGNIARGLQVVEYQQQRNSEALVSAFVFETSLIKLAKTFDEIKPTNHISFERPPFYIKLGFVINPDGTVSNTQAMIQCVDSRA